jgi:hypothetical protein
VRELGPATGAEIECWPCAVGERSGAVHFSGGRGEASRVDPGGGVVVPCVALDDVLPCAIPGYLKMDIEGAEPQALRGARRLLDRARPRLAVCVYHCPDHLWSIGAQIEELDLEYDLHLRAHGFAGFDLVLYATPR